MKVSGRGFRGFSASLLIVHLVVINSFGQSRKPEPQESKPKKTVEVMRPAAIENLIAESLYIPPEFAASLLLRIAQSQKITDTAWKKELLEEAFRLADKAQFSVRKKVLPLAGISVDTSSGYSSYAFDLGLDRLSLRSRVIKAMLRLDKQRARELSLEISPKLPLEALSCRDSMIYQPAEFYEVLRQLAKEGFSPEEIEYGVRAEFLLPYVKTLTSPAQVKPIIDLLLTFKNSPDELNLLIRAFIPALKNISGDDRSFSYSANEESIPRSVLELARAHYDSQKQGDELLGALRTYLVKNLEGARCGDNLITDGKALPYYITEANLIFDNPLSRDEIKQSEILPDATLVKYWETTEASAMLTKIKELSRKEDGEQISGSDAESLEWQQRLRDYLSQLEGWKGDHEASTLTAFHQKCVLYRGLLRRVDKGPLQDTIARSYLQYLSKAAAKEEGRIDWFLHVNELLTLAEGFAEQNNNVLIELLAHSSDTTIRLNAQFKRLRL